MGLLKSCCFWQSIRKGSYASGFFTMIYFCITSVVLSLFLYDERKFLRGEINHPQGESFIGNTPNACPSVTIVFNIMILTCSTLGVIASCFLLIGIHKNCRAMLVPWIFIMLLNIFVEITHSIYVLIFEPIEREKVVSSFIFIADIFVTLLNIYCLLCVISQYQNSCNNIGRDNLSIVKKNSFTVDNHLCSPSLMDTQNTPNTITNPLKATSSLTCSHVNCSTNFSNLNNSKYLDEILPYSDQNYYENC